MRLVADAAANDTACIRQGAEDSAVAMEAAFKSAGVRVAADDAKLIAATLTKLALDPGEKGSRRQPQAQMMHYGCVHFKVLR
jgi:hypothetical protein